MTTDCLLRLPQVLEIIPVSRSAWYQGVKENRFPKPVKLSSKIAAWRMSDIQKLMDGLEVS